jgi:antitoxin component YwqK of YwqJK toxin-antitoxin module
MTKNLLIKLFLLALITSFSGCKEKVDANRLQKRGDFYYTINSEKPFSGESTEYYPSDQIKEIINFKNGRPHGDYQSFYENGQTKEIGAYKLNNYDISEKHGNWKYYGKSGWLGFDTNYDEGDLNGKYMAYYKNGAIWKEGQFLDGEQVGEWAEYGGPNSKIFGEKKYTIDPDVGMVGSYLEYAQYVDEPIKERYYDANGNRYGKSISRNYYGDISSEGIYENGECLEFTYYYDRYYTKDKSDVLSYEYTTKKVTNYIDGKDNRIETSYCYDKIENIFEYRDGMKCRYDYYRKGILISSETYTDGQKYEKNYYENGNLSSEGYEEGYTKVGKWTFYNEDGSVKEITDHDKNGKQVLDENNADEPLITYYKSGIKKASGPKDKDGEWEGMVQFWNEDETLAFEVEYDRYVCNKFKLADGTTPPSFTGELKQYYLNGEIAYLLNYEKGRLSEGYKLSESGIKKEYVFTRPPSHWGSLQRWLLEYKEFHKNGQLYYHMKGKFDHYYIRRSTLYVPELQGFYDGNKFSIFAYDKAGEISYKKDYQNKTEIRYHENGQLMYEASHEILKTEHGNYYYKPTGKINFYNKDGDIDGIKEYADGKLIYEKDYSNGLLYHEDFYHKNGNRTKRLEYDYRGNVETETIYSKDHKSRRRHNDDDRSVLERTEYYNYSFRFKKITESHTLCEIVLDDEGEDTLEYNSQATKCKNYYDNGQLIFEAELAPNKKDPKHYPEYFKGTVKFYYRNGLLFAEKEYGDRSRSSYYNYDNNIADYSSDNHFGWDLPD